MNIGSTVTTTAVTAATAVTTAACAASAMARFATAFAAMFAGAMIRAATVLPSAAILAVMSVDHVMIVGGIATMLIWTVREPGMIVVVERPSVMVVIEVIEVRPVVARGWRIGPGATDRR